ncbi:5-formyltetrahydrofolate cyclo-ligase [Hymenobacter antarcticus]|uniref:5-formyltetrahydrofolate cyclo-ligase n=1 Tax=Hymenobacter antarcticus TaxID=486270 RepID=A0ABP7QEX7_9BACT
MSPDFSKATLRRAALASRQALPPAEVAHRSQQLCEQLFQHFPVAQWRWLHVFLPIVGKHEPDTWRVIHRIWAESLVVRLAAPVMQPDRRSLKHYELTPATPLHKNHWGIAEPEAAAATEVPAAAFDAVLVPLLAVDAAGHRVGYGGGYYDRFLAQCRPGTQFIGLSVLDEPLIDHIADMLPTDVPLTACITPGGVRRF